MITFSIIQKSQLEGAMRIDAEFYCVINDLFCEFVLGKDVIEFAQYGTSKELNESDRGFRVLRLNEFEDFFISKPSKYCDVINENTFNELKLKSGDVLICRTNGNPKLVGKAAIVMEDAEIAFASYLFRVKPKKEIINSASLVSFLNSRFGRSQIERFLMPSIQSNFSPAQFRAIKIPVLPKDIQNEIEALIKNSYILKNEAKNFYSQAENILLEGLDLKDFNFVENLSAVVNFSDILEARRMDAEYFQPKYEKLISTIESQEHKRLGDLVSMKKGIEIGAEQYQDEGKMFIRVSSMGKFEINGSNQKYLSDKLYEKLKSDFQPQVGEILLTKDATPGIAYVLKESIEGIVSGGTLRLKLKEKIESEYLAFCLNSIIGQMQAERDAGGSVIAHWKPEQIKNVFIPILPSETQQKIAELVRKSHEARKKAKELLEEAKRKVEEMIEKGGEKDGKI